MPNRIIREGANSSERVDALTPEAEVFYRRLLNVVDDFGCFDGRIAILIARAFPLKVSSICVADAEQWLSECSAGDEPLIRIYYHSGKRYIEVLNFNQQVRAKSRKWPDPAQADGKAEPISATHVISDAKQMRSTCALNPESETKTKTKTYPESESETKSGDLPVNGTGNHKAARIELDNPGDWFEQRWLRWPAKGRTRRPMCEQYWTQIFFGTFSAEEQKQQLREVDAGISRWLTSKLFNDGYVHAFADFLANRRWAEEPEQVQAPDDEIPYA